MDAASGRVIARLKGDGRREPRRQPAAAGRIVVASRSQSPWLFDLEDGAIVGRLRLGDPMDLRTLALSPRGELLALTEPGAVHIWDLGPAGAHPVHLHPK